MLLHLYQSDHPTAETIAFTLKYSQSLSWLLAGLLETDVVIIAIPNW